MRRLPSSAWILLPQAASRLTSVYVFAVAARRCSPEQLGALAIGTAIASAAAALAPAVVGKPLAAMSDPAARAEQAPMAQSAAIAWITVLAVLLGGAATLTEGLTRLALVAGALGLPAVMVVESTYWRSVFLEGARPAGLRLAAGYLVQAVVVTLAAIWASAETVVLMPAVGLLVVAAVVLLSHRDLSWRGARRWSGPLRASWLPYVLGVLAGLVVVQAIPPVLTATAGLAAASVYRAGELAFGGTNLLIGVASQTLLTQGSAHPRRHYLLVSLLVAAVAAANGIVLALLPEWLIALVLGPVTPLLIAVLLAMTVQRVALSVSSIGATLIVPLVSARVFGVLDVATASLAVAALLTGAVLGGLTGALVGLACVEVVFAVTYGVLLRRTT